MPFWWGGNRMSAAKVARLIWIHGGKNIDPRTAAYFAAKIKRGKAGTE